MLNATGGVTFVVMVSLYDSLRHAGLSKHVAWRAAFAIVPVPILLFTAALVILFGTDHPAGKWNQRHTLPATALSIAHGHQAIIDVDEHVEFQPKLSTDGEKRQDATVAVEAAVHEKRKFPPLNSVILARTFSNYLQSTHLKSTLRSMNALP